MFAELLKEKKAGGKLTCWMEKSSGKSWNFQQKCYFPGGKYV